MNDFSLPSLPQKRYLTVAETSKFCKVTATTLRYWQTEFPMLEPIRRAGRRYYRQEDLVWILKIKHLVHEQKLSIADALIQFKTTFTPPSTPTASLAQSREKLKAYAEAKKKEVSTGLQRLSPEHAFSPQNIAKVCRVSNRTAQRYLAAGKAPYAVCRLLELEARGRVLPDNWRYCFVNARGNLEINQVGEVSENEITSIHWLNSRIGGLNRELKDSQARVKELDSLLTQERAKHSALMDQITPSPDQEFTRNPKMKNPTLYSAKRHLEIVIQAFQGLEEIASRSEGDATSVGNAMVPLIFQAEEVLRELEAVYEKSKKPVVEPDGSPNPTGQPLVLLTFPKSGPEQ
ncbi:MAG TPA: MerR family transcriptional regulator [Cellvibrio sp.]|nr:MerR family transcriptional regulator [Cellvibrio sp.]